MTLSKGVYTTRKKDDAFFVGWAKAPAVDRRFLMGALPVSLAATAASGWVIASEKGDPGAGAWLTGATHEIEGVLTRAPYPMIRVADSAAPFGMRTVLVVAQAKCTSSLDLAEPDQRYVKASGVLIERGARQMLEVPITLDQWLETKAVSVDTNLAQPPEETIGRMSFDGTIMDSKCFFGVMRPGRGRTHKACASLCIRGGIPPSFWVRTRDGKEVVMLMTDANGGPLKDDILPLVADPVRAEGEVVRVGDLLHFRADASAFQRV